MPRHIHYILDARRRVVPADLMTWVQWFEQVEQRVVAKDEVEGVSVSTVFLGVDHRFGGKGPPLLFETMTFGPYGSEIVDRYSSWDDAETGHRATVDRIKRTMKKEGLDA